MAAENANTYLQHHPSDESDNDVGYDSEAAEVSKVGRASKRRKTSHTSSGEDSEDEQKRQTKQRAVALIRDAQEANGPDREQDHDEGAEITGKDLMTTQSRESVGVVLEDESISAVSRKKQKKRTIKSKDKDTPPGVIYLSSLPPYLKPSALRNLLSQRGFEPIARLFLSPASKHKSSSKKNSRQLYTEGWIEFASKKTARRCAETLNAQVIGGKKGGFYHDDVWNMKYLRGMRWEELMAGVREEKREMEGRRDEERRNIMRDTKRFVEGVEEGRRLQGMKRKKESKQHLDSDTPAQPDVKRTWRQFDVKGNERHEKSNRGSAHQSGISDDVKEVLGKIF
ncbi:hypothetical protein LTR84_010044 [Exophiala bonariae]|uniref:Pre-rRNA-processing protein ESF2 n=1 Tax=Exophiala bonariae TaxID=1690606 RepID=A0AAV9NMN0_9EURO|nr:hypothetical protein LTR84_010044 [Exophiala bonariae]